ncbi:N-acetylglucosamine-6-O-sulfatase [subsurface metagenome]
MIFKWPGKTKPGSICDVPVISTDFYPTILNIAGITSKPDQHKDGLSLVPLLEGRKKLDREGLFWHYPHYGNQGGSPGSAIRIEDYKLIEFFEDHHVELYHLGNDIGEKQNIAESEPEKTRELLERLHEWQNEVGAKFPTPNPN